MNTRQNNLRPRGYARAPAGTKIVFIRKDSTAHRLSLKTDIPIRKVGTCRHVLIKDRLGLPRSQVPSHRLSYHHLRRLVIFVPHCHPGIKTPPSLGQEGPSYTGTGMDSLWLELALT